LQGGGTLRPLVHQLDAFGELGVGQRPHRSGRGFRRVRTRLSHLLEHACIFEHTYDKTGSPERRSDPIRIMRWTAQVRLNQTAAGESGRPGPSAEQPGAERTNSGVVRSPQSRQLIATGRSREASAPKEETLTSLVGTTPR
jgi:hypothetical protein